VDVIHAYSVALTRRTTQRHMEQAVRLDAYTPPSVEVTEIAIEAGSLVDGKRMREIPFPGECVVASLQRRQKVFIPRGNTLLLAGDVLVVVAAGSARDEVIRLCRKPEEM